MKCASEKCLNIDAIDFQTPPSIDKLIDLLIQLELDSLSFAYPRDNQ